MKKYKRPKTRADQILREFRKFHEANPRVWELFKKFSIEASNSGRSHYSAKAIFERIRWHIEIETKGSDLKLNNNYTAYYARLFHLDQPELDGFFRVRKLVSQEKIADGRDRQVFINKQHEIVDQITHRCLIGILNESVPTNPEKQMTLALS